jgi:SAGA-associated factor 29
MQKSSETLGTSFLGQSLSSVDNAIINEKIREFHSILNQIQEERNRSEHNLTNISKTHQRMQNEPQKPYYKQKLRGLYKTAIQDTDSESDILRKALELIHEIRTIVKSRQRKSGLGFTKETAIRRGALMKRLQQNALTLPLFIGKRAEDTAPPYEYF